MCAGTVATRLEVSMLDIMFDKINDIKIVNKHKQIRLMLETEDHANIAIFITPYQLDTLEHEINKLKGWTV
jgi:hypothetical protein